MTADTAETRRGRVGAVADEGDAVGDAFAARRRRGPLSLRSSLLIWAVMAVLAWGVVALVIHFL